MSKAIARCASFFPAVHNQIETRASRHIGRLQATSMAAELHLLCIVMISRRIS